MRRLISLLGRFRRKAQVVPEDVPSLEPNGDPGASPEEIEASAAQLRIALGDLEKAFGTIVSKVSDIADLGQKIIPRCEDLLRLASGQTEGAAAADRAIKLLDRPMRHIDACLEQRTYLAEVMRRCAERVDQLIRTRDGMSRELAPLPYLSLMFRVEAARLPVEAQLTFQTVPEELANIRRLFAESIDTNANLLREAQVTLASIEKGLQADFEALAQDVSRRRERMNAVLAALEKQISENRSRDIRLQQHGNAVNTAISEIVQALQFQDIIQQRTAHVIEALEKIAPEPESRSLSMQSSQLTSVAFELRSGVGAVSSGLTAVRRKAEFLEDYSTTMDEWDSMTASGDGMVQMLLETISEVAEITGRVDALVETTRRALNPVSQVSQKLSTVLVDLGINMHIVALNAQIRSAAQVEGTGLESLAAMTAELANKVSSLSLANSKEMGRLRDDIGEMLALFDRINADGLESLGEFRRERESTELDLHDLRDKTLEALQMTSATIEDMRSLLNGLDQALVPAGGAADTLAAVGEQVDALAARSPMADKLPEWLAEHAARYTMASERAVHAAVFGDKTQESDGAAPQSEKKEDPNASVGVELF